jgi:hypothetical protein
MLEQDRQELIRKWREMFKAPVQVLPAEVTSPVDENELTVSVKQLDGTERTDVRLKAAVDEVTDGMVEYPKNGSTVLIGIIGNDSKTAFIVKCSEVDKVVFFGGERPLVDWPKLKDELDKTNAVVQALVDAITEWVIVPSDGGAAFKTIASTKLGGKAVGEYEELDDEKILH